MVPSGALDGAVHEMKVKPPRLTFQQVPGKRNLRSVCMDRIESTVNDLDILQIRST